MGSLIARSRTVFSSRCYGINGSSTPQWFLAEIRDVHSFALTKLKLKLPAWVTCNLWLSCDEARFISLVSSRSVTNLPWNTTSSYQVKVSPSLWTRPYPRPQRIQHLLPKEMSESAHRTWRDRKAAFKTPPPQIRDPSTSQEHRRKKVSHTPFFQRGLQFI